jgi:hypothetical protein
MRNCLVGRGRIASRRRLRRRCTREKVLLPMWDVVVAREVERKIPSIVMCGGFIYKFPNLNLRPLNPLNPLNPQPSARLLSGSHCDGIS